MKVGKLSRDVIVVLRMGGNVQADGEVWLFAETSFWTSKGVSGWGCVADALEGLKTVHEALYKAQLASSP